MHVLTALVILSLIFMLFCWFLLLIGELRLQQVFGSNRYLCMEEVFLKTLNLLRRKVQMLNLPKDLCHLTWNKNGEISVQ